MQVLADTFEPSQRMRAALNQAIAERVFPGAWLHCETRGGLIAHQSCGFTDTQNQIAVNDDTLYDLASLSKLWTMAAWLLISHRYKIDASRSLGDFLPAFAQTDKRHITLRHLLQHNSGITLAIQSFVNTPQVLAETSRGWKGDFYGSIPRHEWVRLLADAPLTNAPGERVVYSCSNYFLLARALSRIIGGSLSSFITQRLIWPLYEPQMWDARITFRPCKYLQPEYHVQIAPTEIIDGETLRGIVHDEAARFWFARHQRGFCGNAGLFSNGDGVLRFARLFLHEGAHQNRQILPPELVARSFSDAVTETQTGDVSMQRAWCWQIDAPLYMSSHAPHGSAGHGGFTGPTLWLHRETQTLCILLNNRVHPTRNGPNRFPTHRKIAQILSELL